MYSVQGWEFDLSIFDLLTFLIFKKDRSWLNRSRRSFKKMVRDLITLGDLWKRSKRANRFRPSFKKIDCERIDFFMIKLIFWLQKHINKFDHFFTLLCPKQNSFFMQIRMIIERLIQLWKRFFDLFDLYKRSTVIKLITSIFEEYGLDQFALVDLWKRSTVIESILITKNNRFVRKTDDRIPNPDSMYWTVCKT